MNSATPFEQPKKSNNQNIIIAVVVVLVLCCCCCVVIGGVRYYMQSQVGGIFSSINQGLSLTPGASGNPLGDPSVATAEAMATSIAQGTLVPAGIPTMPPIDIPTVQGMPTVVVPSTDLNKAIPQGGLGVAPSQRRKEHGQALAVGKHAQAVVQYAPTQVDGVSPDERIGEGVIREATFAGGEIRVENFFVIQIDCLQTVATERVFLRRRSIAIIVHTKYG